MFDVTLSINDTYYTPDWSAICGTGLFFIFWCLVIWQVFWLVWLFWVTTNCEWEQYEMPEGKDGFI